MSSERSKEAAVAVAHQAETLRRELTEQWLGDDVLAAWTPRCQIRVYFTRERYIAAIGPGSEHTVGCSIVHADHGKITQRRLDLLQVGGEQPDALPHELTHVILRDRFVEGPLPPWADEGAAILSDSEAKQAHHRSDLRQALSQHALFSSATLFEMNGYPPAGRFGVFYGQSASLADFLVRRKDPPTFLQFVRIGRERGYDFSASRCYGFRNAAELESAWRHDLDPSLHVAQAAN